MKRAWMMPEEEARTLLASIEDRIRSSNIRIEDRDRLVRLRAMLEMDLGIEPPVIVASAVEADRGERDVRIAGS